MFWSYRARRRIETAEIDRLKAQIHYMNDLFTEIKAQRHDFMKHMIAIQYMLDQGDTAKAKTYINELLDQAMQYNRYIQGEEGHVAGLLFDAFRQANCLGIRVRYDLEVPCSLLPLPMLKQSELLGNLLSNSVEAAKEAIQVLGDAEIVLQTAIQSGVYILQLSNTTLPIPKEMIDRLFRSIVTSKSDEPDRKHEGLGTYVIFQIVSRHQGILEHLVQSNKFTVKIKIPIVQ